MSKSKLLEQLKVLSNADRLAVIEAATRLIREDLRDRARNGRKEDPILRVAGCLSGDALTTKEIDSELYGEDGA